MRTLAVMSEKGGCGKTTLAVNLAVGLVGSGCRVLAVDADPQGNLTMVLLRGQTPEPPTLHDVLMAEADARDAIRPTGTPGLDVLPSTGQLADAAVLLASELGRERRLRLAMRELEGAYDVVICDVGPQRSLLSVNVLNYVAEVWTVCDPGIFAIAGLVGLRESIAGVARFLDNTGVHLAGLVVNRVQRDNLSRDTEAQLRAAFGPLVTTATVPASVKIGEATARYMSVLDYAPASPAAKAFKDLVREVIDHGANDGTRRSIDGVTEADGPDPDSGRNTGPARTGRRRRAG